MPILRFPEVRTRAHEIRGFPSISYIAQPARVRSGGQRMDFSTGVQEMLNVLIDHVIRTQRNRYLSYGNFLKVFDVT